MPVIACCGEALVDFVRSGDHPPSWTQLLGGSPYNVARGLGRLGAGAAFVGAISLDIFGEGLVAGLLDSGVSIEHVLRLDRPTTLSFVEESPAGTRYGFFSEGSADRHFESPDPGGLAGRFDVLHFGSNSLVLEPAASRFEALLETAAAARRLVSLDPNVRAPLIATAGADAYRARLRRLLGRAGVVKVSDEDLAFLEPDLSPERSARRLLDGGAALVLLTRGAQGSAALSASASASRPAVPVEVLDTIGAGDAFLAGALCYLSERRALSQEAVGSLEATALEELLQLASSVAAEVCRRRGADMPRRDELSLGQRPADPS